MLKSETEEHIRTFQDMDKSKGARTSRGKQSKNKVMEKFNSLLRGVKLKNNINVFLRNIKRNNIYSKPVHFQSSQERKHWIDIAGIQINPLLQNIVLILDIIFTLANFVLSTFEAFLPDYQSFKDKNPEIYIINIIAVVIYLFKTVVSLINVDVEHGVHYVYLTDIIKKELFKGRFIVQISLAIIIIVSITNSGPYSDSQVIGTIHFILCIFKIYNLTFSLVKIQLMFINNSKKERYWNLSKVFVFNLLFAHFMASIFLAMTKIDSDYNWYTSRVSSPNWFSYYIWAYYWACTTMITIGYGDFVPVTESEAGIVSALQIFSSIVIAYNISQIGSIILSINQKSKVTNFKIGLLRRINKKHNISLAVNLQLEEYIVQSQKIEEDFEYSKHQQLISSMPEQLQDKYYQAAIVNIYRKLPFFMDLGSQTLVTFFREQIGKVYYPGEYIIKKSFEQQVYIVLKGELGFCFQRIGAKLNDTVIQKIQVNYQNGQPLLLAKSLLNRNQGIYFDIKATKYSYGVSFSIEKFIEILKQSQIDYHYYLMTLDHHQGQVSTAINKCVYCPGSFHTKFQCPKLHFMPLSTIVISKHNCASQHINRNQIRLQSYRRRSQLRKSHVYKLKFELGGKQEDREINIKDIDDKTYLEWIMILFGDKSISKRNVSNKAIKKVLLENNLFPSIAHHDEENEPFEEPMDFYHYFTSFNPERLQMISLSTRRRKASHYQF